MHEKDLVSRTNEGAKGRSHIYKAKLTEARVSNKLQDSLINRVFGGSTGKLVLNALGKGKTSKEELMGIRKLLNKLESDKDHE